MTKFKGLHPGGVSVLLDGDVGAHNILTASTTPSNSYVIAGKDATEAFYGLHRHEILEKPQYARLQIGTLKNEKSVIYARIEGAMSDVPYAEPTWLSKGYHSPYYKEVCPYYTRPAVLLCLTASCRPTANSNRRCVS